MIEVHQIPGSLWPKFAADAHKAIFAEELPSSQKKIDFALLVVDSATQLPQGYVTCKELEDRTVLWSFGGAFPPAKGSAKAWAGFQAIMQKCRALGYHRSFFLVENTNRSMLRFAAAVGATIIGARVISRQCWLEHLLEIPA